MPAFPGVKRAMIPMMPVLPLASSHIFIYLYIISESLQITPDHIVCIHTSPSTKSSSKPCDSLFSMLPQPINQLTNRNNHNELKTGQINTYVSQTQPTSSSQAAYAPVPIFAVTPRLCRFAPSRPLRRRHCCWRWGRCRLANARNQPGRCECYGCG